MSTLHTDIGELTVKQRAILELRLKRKRANTTPAPIARQEESKTFPLSFAQQRLWFIDQLAPGSALYNMRAAVRLRGNLNVKAFEQTLTEIVRRHEALRTTFTSIDGEPVQVIGDAHPVTLPLIEVETEAEAVRLATEEAQQPFDLSTGPLFRASLLKLGEREHVVLMTMHHIISDGWSMGVFVRELGTLYEAFIKGQPSPLPELTIRYVDYAAWQRGWLQGEVLEQQLGYWRKQLSGAPPVLELPTDYPRPVVQSLRGAIYLRGFSIELRDGVRALSQREGVTLFMTLLTAFQVLLSRYSGQHDICVGTPIANRTRVEMESLIGFFVNTLVLRTDMSDNPTIRELLQRVREVTLGAYAHQDVPFEKLVEELGVERSLGHTPLFQVMFSLQKAPREGLHLPELDLSSLGGEAGTSPFDMTLSMVENEDGFRCAVEYSTALFTEAAIARMVRHLETVIAAMVATPEARVSDLVLLSADEKQQILVEFNQTAAEYPNDLCIHQLFEQQVARTPDATALVYGKERLSYRQLNERANQFAHRLLELGVGPETKVALMVERSVEMVVSVLGILKAGGAYVPMDPGYPAERISWMLEDSEAPVLVTQERLLDRIPEQSARVICIDSEWDRISNNSTENPGVNVSAGNLAYVIFTSGSTGRPKGVMVAHRNLANHATGFIKTYNLTSNDRVLQFASLSFDVAAEELFPTLVCGATLVLRPESILASFANLVELVEQEQLTVLDLPAAYWHEWVADLNNSTPVLPPSLRIVIVGGERPLPERVAQWHELIGEKVPFSNAYGPTETTITATTFDPIVNEVNRDAYSIPIGRPMANHQLFVLDKQLRPAPIGVAGELHIGGAGLARGYLNRAELTADRFIPNPFSEVAGERLYRTGDLARYLPSGDVEYLGRTDEQVKIRGFRIELGEIETVLAAHAGVREAVVVAREDQRGKRVETRLVAYVVTQSEVSARELREYLLVRLPEYMVPAAVVLLSELPLTSSGKLDRRALPAPDELGDDVESYVGPRTEIEELLCGIWSEVLGIEQVGVTANFFELGGHSLLATQVVSRVREAFGVELAVRVVFETPTVEGMAEQIETLSREAHAVSAPPIVRVSREGGAPLSFAQQRLWFIDQLEPGTAVYNLPVAVRMIGELNLNALERTLSEMVRRHEVLRTTFTSIEGEPVQLVGEPGPVIVPITDLQHLDESEREAEAHRLASEEAQRPFDLSNGPLMRAGLLRLGEQDHVVLMTMHHIISDGWSSGVLVREVGALYEAYTRGEESPLAELPVQYADYAAWQRGWLQGEVLERELGYWREQLSGAAVLELPTDHPRRPVQSHNGARVSFSLPDELSASLRALSRREGVTMFMTLLAAFQTLLYRYSKQEDISIGTDIANRNRSETESLIGFFVNMLVMRADLSGRPSFRDLLRQVREQALGAYAHQDMPFDKLVEDLQPKRDPSRHPLFDVVFGFHNTPMRELELGQMELRPFEFESWTIQYDLILWMIEMNGGLSGSMSYDSDLFNESTITKMVGHFQTLLESIVKDPDQRISDLRLFSETETGGLAATNFTKAKLNQKDFESLLAAISKSKS